MAALDNLGKQQFFHGTTAKLNVGDILQPSTELGSSPWQHLYDYHGAGPKGTSKPRGSAVFMLPTEKRAWGWAKTWGASSIPHEERTRRVYQVEPIGDIGTPGQFNLAGGSLVKGERVASSAKVIAENVIPPPVKGKPVQGRLPGLNWDDSSTKHGNSDDPSEVYSQARRNSTSEASINAPDRLKGRPRNLRKLPFPT